MKTLFEKFLVFFILMITIVSLSYSQTNLTLLQEPDLYTEADIYLDENFNKYSDLVTVQFNGDIVSLPTGESDATINDISNRVIRNYLNSLVDQYGIISLEKVFPNSFWGDTVRVNKRTGEFVIVSDISQIFYMHFSNLIPLEIIINQLRDFNDIKYAEAPYEIYSLSTEPNDPWYIAGEHWNLDSTFAKFAWDFTLGNSSITISINDVYNSNVTSLHEDLVGKVDYHYYNYYGGHGSQVASVAGVNTNNYLGIASLGWNLHLRLDRSYYLGIYDAITDGADVINFSWVNSTSNPLLSDAIHSALLQGIVCVAGAGNSNYTPPITLYPAAYNFGSDGQVIAVSATQLDPLFNYSEHFAYTWNYSPGTDPIFDPTNAFIDVCAPGVLVPVVEEINSTGYLLKSGTSFSSPLVGALSGLILSVDNTFTPVEVYSIIISTTDKLNPNNAINYQYDENGWSRWMGYGRINAHDALNVASGAPHRPRDLVVSANSIDEAQLDWSVFAVEEIDQYKIYRAHTAGGPPVNWYLVATIAAWVGFPNPIPVTSWTDVGTTVGTGPHKLWYYIGAVNDVPLESLPSNTDWIAWNKYGKKNNNEEITRISGYHLEVNYPNPFNPTTTINYTLKEDGFVSLKVYDLLGSEVVDLVNEKQTAGAHIVTFNSDDLNSGVYFYRLVVNDFTQAKKMILAK